MPLNKSTTAFFTDSVNIFLFLAGVSTNLNNLVYLQILAGVRWSPEWFDLGSELLLCCFSPDQRAVYRFSLHLQMLIWYLVQLNFQIEQFLDVYLDQDFRFLASLFSQGEFRKSYINRISLSTLISAG